MNAQDRELLERICEVSGNNPEAVRRLVKEIFTKVLDGRLG